MRFLYLAAGWLSLVLGGIGIVLPVLPTVPFVILAAYCFARSSPRLEAWLVGHPRYGPHIRAWRDHGAISRRGKVAALIAYVAAAGVGLIFAPWPWLLAPVAVAAIGMPWIWTRPDA
jgi:uncharacterized membrane protein YbaN (DUF454 family)